MSGGVGAAAPSGFGLLGQLIADSKGVSNRLATLTEQASSGLVSQTYAGLGGNAAVSLNLHPQLTALQTWQDNISQAAGSMQVTQSAMTQLQSIASTFVASSNSLGGVNTAGIDSVAANARAALTQVAGLLDTQDGSSYVFGGQDTANPPVPSPDSILTSGFYTQINGAVSSGLATGATAATISAATMAVGVATTAPNSPFSAYMSQPLPSLLSSSTLSAPLVQVGATSMIQTGLLASANSVATSPGVGTTSTGSYMRDLMRALATIGSMSSAQVADPGFAGLVQDTMTSLHGVVSAMATDAGALGDRQSSMTATQTALSDTATSLKLQVSNVEEVDMAKTLSTLTQTQTQLQASYQLIAGEQGLSLVKFLPAG